MNLRILLPVGRGGARSLALPAAAPAASTTLVINEVDYDQPSTDTAEFLELKNVSARRIDLDPYSVELVNGNAGGAAVYRTVELPAVDLAAGDLYVDLRERGEHAELRPGRRPRRRTGSRTARPTRVGLRNGTTLVDALSYEGNTGAPYTEGAGAGSTTRPRPARASRAGGADTDRNNADFLLRADHARRGQRVPAAADPVRRVRRRRRHADPRHPGQRRRVAASPASRRDRGRRGRRLPGAGGLGGFFVQEEDADARRGSEHVGGPVRRLGRSRWTPATSSACAGRSAESFGRTQLGSVTRVEVCPGEGTVTRHPVALPSGASTNGSRSRAWPSRSRRTLTIVGVLRLRPLQRDRPHRRPPDDHRRPCYEPGLARGGRARSRRTCARPDHARRRPQRGEPGSRAPPGRRHLRPRPPLPRRRHGGGRRPACWTSPSATTAIQPTAAAEYTEVNARPAEPEDVGGNVKVGSFNVLNYFTTLGRRARREHAGGVRAPADEDHRGDHGDRRRRRRPDRDREQRRGAADLVDGLNEATGARALRLHRDGRHRHGRDQGRVRLPAGARHAGRRPRDPRLDGRPALHRHAEPARARPDVPDERTPAASSPRSSTTSSRRARTATTSATRTRATARATATSPAPPRPRRSSTGSRPIRPGAATTTS